MGDIRLVPGTNLTAFQGPTMVFSTENLQMGFSFEGLGAQIRAWHKVDGLKIAVSGTESI